MDRARRLTDRYRAWRGDSSLFVCVRYGLGCRWRDWCDFPEERRSKR